MGQDHFKIKKGLTFEPQATPPASPIDGDSYYDSALGTFIHRQGGAWINLMSMSDVASAADLTSGDFTVGKVQNSLVRVTGAIAGNIHGLSASGSAKSITLYNASSVTQTIKHQSVTEGTVSNRITTSIAADYALTAGQVTVLFYDSTLLSWVANVPTLSANTSLSNLTSPTAVNQSLLPTIASSLDLGAQVTNQIWNKAFIKEIKNEYDGSVLTTADNTLRDRDGNAAVNAFNSTYIDFNNKIFKSIQHIEVPDVRTLTDILGASPNITIHSGDASLAGTSGTATFSSGFSTGSATTGLTTVKSGDNYGTGNSGGLELQSGISIAGNSGNSGFQTGSAAVNSGNIIIQTGNGGVNSGNISIYPGLATTGTPGQTLIQGGGASIGNGGNTIVQSGVGPTGSGSTYIGTSHTGDGAVSGPLFFQTGNCYGTAPVQASVVYDTTIIFTAVTAGLAGNSIALAFNGTTDTITYIVGLWNSANPLNTVSFIGELGTFIPTAGTATLINGADPIGSASGAVSFISGISVYGSSGTISISSGSSYVNSGDVNITTGAATTGTRGSINITSRVTTISSAAATAIQSDSSPAGVYNSANVSIRSGNTDGSGNTGHLLLNTGITNLGISGQIQLVTGTTYGFATGAISLQSGHSYTHDTGEVFLNTGLVTGTGMTSGGIRIVTGDGNGTDNNSGALTIAAGTPTGTGTKGTLYINVEEVRITTNLGLDMGSRNITSLLDPTSPQHAATAAYVDTPKAIYNAGSIGATPTITWSNGESQKATITASATFIFAAPVANSTYLLKILQSGAGGFTYTWPANVRWIGGTGPVGSATGLVDIITFWFDGTDYFGNFAVGYV